MNIIKTLYNKIKTSWDNYLIEFETLPFEQKMTIMNNFKGEQP